MWCNNGCLGWFTVMTTATGLACQRIFFNKAKGKSNTFSAFYITII